MVKEIPLTQGKVALVDDEDFERVSKYKWCAKKNRNKWYATRWARKDDGKSFEQKMHRTIIELNNEELVDHINGDGLDNRKCNLRKCNNRENAANTGIKNVIKTSRYKGVSFYKETKRWKAQIRICGIKKHIGYFVSEEQAAQSYDDYVIENFKEFGVTNKSMGLL